MNCCKLCSTSILSMPGTLVSCSLSFYVLCSCLTSSVTLSNQFFVCSSCTFNQVFYVKALSSCSFVHLMSRPLHIFEFVILGTMPWRALCPDWTSNNVFVACTLCGKQLMHSSLSEPNLSYLKKFYLMFFPRRETVLRVSESSSPFHTGESFFSLLMLESGDVCHNLSSSVS